MSASLVGSEMCIRDRWLRVAQVKSSNGTQLDFMVAERRLAKSRRSVPLPVSYTHLTLPTICSV
eukprot:681107-Alexandrium_andersonii.AAC.1